MTQKNKNGVVYLSFPELERIAGLRHLFSTRKGGVSRGEFSQMNFSFTRGDDPEAVRENYRRISEVLGYQGRLDVFVTSYQTHTVNIRRVSALDSGKGVTRERDYRDIDGLITNERGLVLTTFHADCTPLYFVDEVHHAIGLAHSGWRGTVNDMAGEMVRRMGEEFGTAPSDLVCAIGPCICGACYEVGRDVYDAFEKKWGREELLRYISKEEDRETLETAVFHLSPNLPEGKYLLDLRNANLRNLEKAGVPRQKVAVTNYCTKENPALLFSHRAQGEKRGNLAAFLTLA